MSDKIFFVHDTDDITRIRCVQFENALFFMVNNCHFLLLLISAFSVLLT